MSNEEVRILIIDDEQTIRNFLRVTLEAVNFKVFEASDGHKGLAKISECHPHIVLLDLGLPDMSGDLVLKELRKWSRVPVIILTVADEEQIKVTLLEAGADDYLTKPFGSKELIARIRVALRNLGMIEATPVFVSDELKVDLFTKKVFLDHVEIKLTNTEYDLLAILVRDNGKVIPQSVLLKKVWGAASDDQSHYLRIYINQLRKKLEKKSSQPKHILTESGVGYRIV